MLRLGEVALAVLIVTLPFGYWRAGNAWFTNLSIETVKDYLAGP